MLISAFINARKDALTILAERPVLPRVTIIIANYVGTEQEWILRSWVYGGSC